MMVAERKKLSIGMVGQGTVGTAVAEILNRRKPEFLKGGYDFSIRRVCIKNPCKKRSSLLKKEIFTTSISEILDAREINTVIEVSEGESAARAVIRGALERGKNVITANKRVVFLSGGSIAREAAKKESYFGFRAALTGCYGALGQLLPGGDVKSISGVFNGTANYVLTRMKEKGIELEDALKEAQELGYAESDPSEDIDGIDTGYKIGILTMLAFGFNSPRNMLVEGIRDVTLEDIRFADGMGYEIRLMGISAKNDGEIDVRVHPVLVPKNSVPALLRGAQNYIEINDVLKGVSSAIQEGAGGYPAAGAVVRDLIAAADKSTANWPLHYDSADNFRFLCPGKIKTEYYLSIRAANRPGVLSAISSAFAGHDINISSIIQPEGGKGDVLPLVFVTGKTFEQNIKIALREISGLRGVEGSAGFFRFWDGITG